MTTKLKKNEATGIEWCHVINGKVHAAIWSVDTLRGGCLTTYTTVEDRHHEEHLVCFGQTWTKLEELEHPWRDRNVLAKQLKIKVCPVCEEDLDTWEAVKDALGL